MRCSTWRSPGPAAGCPSPRFRNRSGPFCRGTPDRPLLLLARAHAALMGGAAPPVRAPSCPRGPGRAALPRDVGLAAVLGRLETGAPVGPSRRARPVPGPHAARLRLAPPRPPRHREHPGARGASWRMATAASQRRLDPQGGWLCPRALRPARRLLVPGPRGRDLPPRRFLEPPAGLAGGGLTYQHREGLASAGPGPGCPGPGRGW